MTTESSRRTFLGATAGLAGLSALTTRHAAATIVAEPWGIKLGIATYSLRSFDRTAAIGMLKKLQTKYVSIKDVHLKLEESPEELQQHRKEFDDAGLIVTSGGNVDMTKGSTIEYLRPKFEY